MTTEQMQGMAGKTVRLRKIGTGKIILVRVRRDVGYGYWEVVFQDTRTTMILPEEYEVVHD